MAFGMSFSGSPGYGRGNSAPQARSIIAAVANAIAADREIESSCIVVSISDDVLVLSGEAPSTKDRDRAIDIAAAITGGFIRNRIWVRSA